MTCRLGRSYVLSEYTSFYKAVRLFESRIPRSFHHIMSTKEAYSDVDELPKASIPKKPDPDYY